ncbi:hypothetical protein D9M70_397210 [compost metagenome]
MVGTHHGIAPAQPEILQRPALDHVADVDVALPGLAVVVPGHLGMVAAGVASHGRQAGNAQGGEVVVIAQLPGALVSSGEVAYLDVVDQRRAGARDEDHAVVAVHALVAGADRVPAIGGAEEAGERAVVQLTQVRAALVAGGEQADVGAQGPVADLLLVRQVVETLLVDIFQLRLPQADLAAPGVEAVFRTQVVESIGKHPATAIDRQVLVVGGVALAQRAHLPAMQGQAGNLLRGEHAALEGLRQQAAIVAQQDRQLGQQFADFQFGVRQLQFRCHSKTRVFIRGASVVMPGQQARAGAVRAAVQLQAELSDQIDADAQHTRRIA